MTRNKYDDNTDLWSGRLNADYNAHNHETILNGCTPTKGTGDWDVDIASGEMTVGDGIVTVSSTTEDLTDPTSDMSAGEERIVIVTLNSSGNSNSVEGSAVSSDPATPDIPSDEVLVATIHVENSDSTLADSDLFDDRVLAESVTTELPSDVTGSRSDNTWEQNTTGNMLFVLVVIVGESPLTDTLLDARGHINSSASNNIVARVQQESEHDDATLWETVVLLVGDDLHYKVNVSDGSILQWHEQEVGYA